MHIFVIAMVGVVVTFAPLAVMLTREARIRPRQRLWQGLSITVFCGAMMVCGALFAAGLTTTPTTPPSEFWRW